MSGIRLPKQCGLFKPGHDPHWIQIFRATEDRVNLRAPGHVIDLRNDGTVVIDVQQNEYRLWNHDVERLAEAVAAADGQFSYQARWGLLRVPTDDGHYAFCMAKTDVHVRCPDEAPTGTAVELLASAGGFTVSIQTLMSQRFEPHSPNS